MQPETPDLAWNLHYGGVRRHADGHAARLITRRSRTLADRPLVKSWSQSNWHARVLAQPTWRRSRRPRPAACRARFPRPASRHADRKLNEPQRRFSRRGHDLNVPPGGVALSTRARFRGPLVAQTSIGRLAQPCEAGSPPGQKVPANEAVPRRSSLHVVVPDSACHAGGRGFESRRSRSSKCQEIEPPVLSNRRRRLPRQPAGQNEVGVTHLSGMQTAVSKATSSRPEISSPR
jgi:hypothetical protein